MVATLPDGGAVAVWWSVNQDGDDGGIFGQRFERNVAMGRLDPVGGEFPVNTFTDEDRLEPEVMSWDDGFLFSWTSENKGRNSGDNDRPTGGDGMAPASTRGLSESTGWHRPITSASM